MHHVKFAVSSWKQCGWTGQEAMMHRTATFNFLQRQTTPEFKLNQSSANIIWITSSSLEVVRVADMYRSRFSVTIYKSLTRRLLCSIPLQSRLFINITSGDHSKTFYKNLPVTLNGLFGSYQRHFSDRNTMRAP
jgi:hypothetical protein